MSTEPIQKLPGATCDHEDLMQHAKKVLDFVYRRPHAVVTDNDLHMKSANNP